LNAHIKSIDILAGQSGRFALACQAHVQTLFPSIDEPEQQAVLSHVPSSRALTHTKDIPMNTGTVKFYNDQKGFGFIQPDNGSKDIFVHATALERAGMRGLVEGQKVTFDTAEDRRSGKIAVNNIQTA
jgi:CspA family cold shock protein